MLNKSVARRYAEAFFGIAREADKIDAYQAELEKVISTIAEVDGMKEYLDHLLVPAREKKDLVQKVFGTQLSPMTMNFLFMIIDKRRESYLEFIYREYVEMADESRNIKKAELFAAREVPQQELDALEERLSASTGKKVMLKLTVDPTLLGGAKIRMGDQIVDGTAVKKLQMLTEKLKKAKIS
ncbi:MAG TPA: ATP synthase F1 subunit delta [Syntrophomonas sp.]|nr:ATP synthase F1 subunit delta [Syntrophomonas sp.]